MKKDFLNFWKKLITHPGLFVVLMLQGLGIVAGLESSDHQVVRALLGLGVFSLCWIPIIWTTWTNRNKN